VEVTEEYTSLRFSPHAISFLTDDLILQRYVEMEGALQSVINVVKMRGSAHSREWCAYSITEGGLVVGEALTRYRGIISGIPVPRDDSRTEYPGLTDGEMVALRALDDLREATVRKVAEETDASEEETRTALERMAALNYALRREKEGATTYRLAARSLKT